MSISQKSHFGSPTAIFRPFFFPPFLGFRVFIAPVLNIGEQDSFYFTIPYLDFTPTSFISRLWRWLMSSGCGIFDQHFYTGSSIWNRKIGCSRYFNRETKIWLPITELVDDCAMQCKSSHSHVFGHVTTSSQPVNNTRAPSVRTL